MCRYFIDVSNSLDDDGIKLFPQLIGSSIKRASRFEVQANCQRATNFVAQKEAVSVQGLDIKHQNVKSFISLLLSLFETSLQF